MAPEVNSSTLPKKTLQKVESLSHIDDSLIVGSKSLKDLKSASLHQKGLNGKNFTGFRADLLNLGDVDSSLAKFNSALDEKISETVSAIEESTMEVMSWEVDFSKVFLKKVIARGTFGIVHRGVYEGQDVAVKLLDWGEDSTLVRSRLSAVKKAFKQEVSVWSTLDHPNITQFIGASLGASTGFSVKSEDPVDEGRRFVGGNICCVVLEYMPGGTLKEFLIKNYNKKLPFRTVMRLALDVSRGLAYLHSKRIIHRDLKSENLLLDRKGTVKIADFGVARAEAVGGDMTEKTGTLGYMAPEVLNGCKYNHKADVYSFGICLWEIYVCDMPFPNLGVSEMIAVVNQGLRPHIPGICPKPLAEIMNKCWDKEPSRRPRMEEVTRMLEAIDVRAGQGMVPLQELPSQRGCFCF